MNRGLLHKTLRTYLTYSLLVLIISAPVFYFATRSLYIQEADDTLLLHKNEFLKYAAPSFKVGDIPAWNTFNRNIKIDSSRAIRQDTLFFTTYYDTLDAEMEPYRELNVPIQIESMPYTYIARINLIETQDIVKNVAFMFLGIIVLLLAGLFFISRKLSQDLWRPFNNTLSQIETFEIDKNQKPIFTPTNIDEFNRLNASIQRLIEKNVQIYHNQKEFIENAAHELQTPLAVFQAQIDTLIQRPDTTQEQLGILSSVNDNISRLSRLNKNLLLLSKIENDNYSDKQRFSINDTIKKNLDFFIEQAKAKNLIVHTELKQEIVVNANHVLTEILVSNLFMNAIRHNLQDGEITVTTFSNQLVFSNTGQPHILNTNKLFNRFSKSNPSGNGTGLGLSIIKKIAVINGWEISYNYTNNLHSFLISL